MTLSRMGTPTWGDVLQSEDLSLLIARHSMVLVILSPGDRLQTLPRPTPLLLVSKEIRLLYLRCMRALVRVVVSPGAFADGLRMVCDLAPAPLPRKRTGAIFPFHWRVRWWRDHTSALTPLVSLPCLELWKNTIGSAARDRKIALRHDLPSLLGAVYDGSETVYDVEALVSFLGITSLLQRCDDVFVCPVEPALLRMRAAAVAAMQSRHNAGARALGCSNAPFVFLTG